MRLFALALLVVLQTAHSLGPPDTEVNYPVFPSSSTCTDETTLFDYTLDAEGRPEGWDELTHSKGELPAYDLMFNDAEVQVIEITIPYCAYLAMMEDVIGILRDVDPIYVQAKIKYKDGTWYRVGIRWKGNSSLNDPLAKTLLKLGFRLTFDKWEDDAEEIKNQRMHGFQTLTFGNAYNDNSFIREIMSGEIFRDNNIVHARSAPWAVHLDVEDGNGMRYMGLYTLTEDPSDEMVQDVQMKDGGNMYKPEAYFTEGFSADGDVTLMNYVYDKKTNEDEADYTDVLALQDALMASTRTEDVASWREELERVFDVDYFLNWLAVTATIQSWDTYGSKPHNYMLYGDPCDKNRLKWFSWDTNEALIDVDFRNHEILMGNIEYDEWPMITYLIADEVYFERYKSFLAIIIESDLLQPDAFRARVEHWNALITPSAMAEETPYTLQGISQSEAFADSVDTLVDHVANRLELVADALGNGFTRMSGLEQPFMEVCVAEGSGVVDGDATLVAGLTFSELMFNGYGATDNEKYHNMSWSGGDFEYVELYNSGSDTLDLSGCYFTDGVELTFPAGTTLLPGAYLLLVDNMDAMTYRYSSHMFAPRDDGFVYPGQDTVVLQYVGGLSNSDEVVVLNDATGKTIFELFWTDDWSVVGWADGDGYSLVPSSSYTGTNSVLSEGEFALSLAFFGTPGGPDMEVLPPDEWMEPEEEGDGSTGGVTVEDDGNNESGAPRRVSDVLLCAFTMSWVALCSV